MKKHDLEKIQLKESLLSTLRAMVRDDEVLVEFSDSVKGDFFSWDHRLIADEKMVVVPEILGEVVVNSKVRAAGDLAAAYLLFHDQKIHAQKKRQAEEQKFFDEFEKARVICQIKNSYLGAAKNILYKLESDIFSGLNSLSLILLNEVFAQEILPKSKRFAVELEESLTPKIVREIKNLAQKISSQSDFELGLENVLDLLKKNKKIKSKKSRAKNRRKKVRIKITRLVASCNLSVRKILTPKTPVLCKMMKKNQQHSRLKKNKKSPTCKKVMKMVMCR